MCRYQHRESNVLYQQPQWRHIQLYLKPRQDMSGTGILSQIVEYAREYGPKVVEAYSGEMGTKIKNLIDYKKLNRLIFKNLRQNIIKKIQC